MYALILKKLFNKKCDNSIDIVKLKVYIILCCINDWQIRDGR